MDAGRLILRLLTDETLREQVFYLLVLIAVVSTILSITATWLNFLKTRLEREKWKHEKESWKINLISQVDLDLFKKRLESYPLIMQTLSPLSDYMLDQIPRSTLKKVATELHRAAYGEPGLFMDSDTRKEIVKLRDLCQRFAAAPDRGDRSRLRRELLRRRTDVIERLRRDLGHRSIWRPDLEEFLSLSDEKARSALPAGHRA